MGALTTTFGQIAGGPIVDGLPAHATGSGNVFNLILAFLGLANAVNYLQAGNAAAGDPPSLAAVGANTDLDLSLVTQGKGVIQMGSTIVANLPAAGVAGRRFFVTDATVTTFASIVAGTGGNGVPVYDDGTHWRIG